MKISLIHPSRSRPKKSFENSQEWLKKAGNVDVELIVAVDTTDRDQAAYLALYGGQCIVFDHTSVVHATNNAAAKSTGDILVYLSDDFKCPENWGEKIIERFESYSLGNGINERPLMLKVDDALQKFDVTILTIPIMNRALYEKLGYMWHPLYKSMHVDVDLYFTCMKLGAVKMCKDLVFEHHHPANGKAENDEVYKRSAANWNQGLDILNRRKKQGFPV